MCFYSHFNFRILSAKEKGFITESGPPGNTKGHALTHRFLACPTFFLALSSLCPKNTRCYKGTTGIKGMHFLHSTLCNNRTLYFHRCKRNAGISLAVSTVILKIQSAAKCHTGALRTTEQ